ncbi:MAG: Asp23/Gls24 family envelope stress response protein [Caldisericia bacterium]|jgi:uncharacterized alkaline shock family protein YloU|nr:Asp23/Gls24 family envelope stress response protein [Caldisericia bacterium]
MKGKSFIHKNAIRDIAILSALRCYGIIGMAPVNILQKIEKALGSSEATRGVEVEFFNGKFIIKYHIIVSKGINIKEVINNLIEQAEFSFKKMIHIKPEIKVFVEEVKEE